MLRAWQRLLPALFAFMVGLCFLISSSPYGRLANQTQPNGQTILLIEVEPERPSFRLQRAAVFARASDPQEQHRDEATRFALTADRAASLVEAPRQHGGPPVGQRAPPA